MKISVIVPSFNQAVYLPATLDSLLAQEFANLEVLVFDGGSTDGSVAVLEDFDARHPGRLWWTSGRDGGQADAINRGLAQATGDVLAYLNSDDVLLPGALARVAEHFTAHPDCAILYGRAYHLHADGSVMEDYPTEPWEFPRLLETCYLCQPAVFWRREVMERFGVFDPELRYAMDYEYWLRLGRAGVRFDYLADAVLAGSRLHGETKTLSQRAPAHREMVAVVQRHADPADPAPVTRWLLHLAHHRAAETADDDPGLTGPARRAFVTAFAAHALLSAAEFGVALGEPTLARLEADLASVGA